MDKDVELSGGIIDEVELEIAREAARKAQREHEEKQRRKEELEKKREELERQRLELVERQRVERERLMEKIRRAEERKGRSAGVSVTSSEGTPVVESPAATKVEESVNGQVKEKEEVNGNGKETDDGAEKTGASPPSDETSRKAQLQKMLADLQNQVFP